MSTTTGEQKKMGRPRIFEEDTGGIVKYVRLPQGAVDDLLKLQYLRHGEQASTIIRAAVLEYLDKPEVRQEMQRLRVVE